MKRYLKYVIMMSLLVVAVYLIQPPSSNAAQLDTPVLWLWQFDVSYPYPNPCSIDWVKVNLNLACVDTDLVWYDIYVTSKVYNSAGQLVQSTDHGWISPSSSYPIVVISNAQSLAAGTYVISVTGSCPTFGKSETETKKSIVL